MPIVQVLWHASFSQHITEDDILVTGGFVIVAYIVQLMMSDEISAMDDIDIYATHKHTIQHLQVVWMVFEISIDVYVVIIVGRFRVACCLKCFEVVSPECRIVFDDFLTRPYYHAILEFYEIVEKTEDECLVVLKKKDVTPPPPELIARYELITD